MSVSTVTATAPGTLAGDVSECNAESQRMQVRVLSLEGHLLTRTIHSVIRSSFLGTERRAS